MEKTSFYCLRCRKSFEARGKAKKLKGGKQALTTKCPACKTVAYRIVASKK